MGKYLLTQLPLRVILMPLYTTPPTNIGLDLGILWMCITFTITLHDVVTYDVNDNLVFVAILLLIERVRVTESCDTPSNIGASSL